ncbi:MAG: TIGR04438 family Trp-rich protein [Comamonadaceae bacterium]|nr:TIGR04438 family Trp-rich protein [Burkholderiales bacterium]MEB2348795.1 TIGR04438 family Trp-rich protein [Comamonadaceae bacterium]
MYTLILGIVLIALKVLEVDPVAAWSWWWVLAPLAVTAVWWVWADMSGYNKRKAMEKMAQRKQARIDRQKTALGVGSRRPR